MSAIDPYHKWLGIPPDEQPPNHYRLLGIKLLESDPDVIAHAADQRMLHIRTFQTGANSAVSQKILNEIASARLCLLDANEKLEYDLLLGMESSQPVLPAVYSAPVTLIPLASPSRRKRQSASWMPWAVAGSLTLLVIIVIVVAFVNRHPTLDATDVTTNAPKKPAAQTSGKPQPELRADYPPFATEEPKSVTTEEPVPVAMEEPKAPTTEAPKQDVVESREPATVGGSGLSAKEEPNLTPQRNLEDLLKPDLSKSDVPKEPIAAGMISWQSNNKVLTGLFKEVKGPIVFAEAEDKSPASVSLKSLSPESQAYVASEIRNRKSRLFDLLASDKPEATMQQDVVATATRVQLPARITEVITSKGRALKVNLSFEGLPRRVTTRQQMTLRSDPEDFVNVRAGDLVLFEGKPSAYVKPCAFCSGTALAKCPACRGTGGVLGPVRTELRTMPDGRVVSSSGPTVVPCGSCGGSGKTKCSHPVPSKSEEWTPLERKRESRTVASVSNSKGQQNLVVELQDMLICIVPEATKEPLYFGSTPKEEHR